VVAICIILAVFGVFTVAVNLVLVGFALKLTTEYWKDSRRRQS